jgi:hypothetical protein
MHNATTALKQLLGDGARTADRATADRTDANRRGGVG